MFYSFRCESCEHTFDSNIGDLSTKVITAHPCIKCNKKTVVVNNIIKPSVILPSRTTPALIANSNRLGDKGIKGTPKEFKDLLAKMKSENPGSTIKDRR